MNSHSVFLANDMWIKVHANFHSFTWTANAWGRKEGTQGKCSKWLPGKLLSIETVIFMSKSLWS